MRLVLFFFVLLVLFTFVNAELDPGLKTLVYEDDFSIDPNINSDWEISRLTVNDGPGGSEGVWDEIAHNFILGAGESNAGIQMLLRNYELHSSQWTAEFDVKITSGVVSCTDLFGLQFYTYPFENWHYPYSGYDPLKTDYRYRNDPNLVSHIDPWFGVEIDSYLSPPLFSHPVYSSDTSSNQIALVSSEFWHLVTKNIPICDLGWVPVVVNFDDGRVSVSYNGMNSFDHTIDWKDYDGSVLTDPTEDWENWPNKKIGFYGTTGSDAGEQRLDNFKLYCYPSCEVCDRLFCAAPTCGSFDDGCGDTVTNCNMNLPHTLCINESGCDPLDFECNGFLQCEAGYLDCNGDMSDGCENHVDENSSSCGTCGYSCPGAVSCVNGVCRSDNFWYNFVGERVNAVEEGDFVRVFSLDDFPFVVSEDWVTNHSLTGNVVWRAVKSEYGGYNISSSTHYSGDLLTVVKGGSDDVMSLEILNPPCSMYNLSDLQETILINASDPDDLIEGVVEIDGEVVYVFTNVDGNLVEFDYNFSSAGSVNIVVRANNSRGEKRVAVSNIMIADNSSGGDETQYYVASCIDYPKNIQEFGSSHVYFDASSSKAVKYSKSSDTFEVISGERLFYDWTFFMADGSMGSCKGLGTFGCNELHEGSVIQFYRTFPTVDNNHVSLSVSLPESEMI